MASGKLIQEGFLTSVSLFPERPALEVEGRMLSYAGLYELAAQISATLREHGTADGPPLTALFAYRSLTAFAGVLGILLRGHGYVPLNRTFPVERTRHMLERSETKSLVVDQASAPQLDALLDGWTRRLLIILPEHEDIDPLQTKWPLHRFLGEREMTTAKTFSPVHASPDSIAYLLFTSGSTGSPKGVMVAQRNVRSYMDFVVRRYAITESDRCSQTFDMTFDLSAHDMFVAWECGACVCCPTQKELIKPDRFINDSRLTIWFSVPSTAVFMRRLGLLKPGMYPTLRLSLFCGEALPLESARDWVASAPNSIIENIYGPTELTIACTAYRWDSVRSPAECEQGVVPIGEPFPAMEAFVADEDLREVEPGAPGELLMTGPQLSLGYWRDEDKTKYAFVTPPGKHCTYYRTGDRVRRPLHGRPMVYLGRMDNQVKILGHRVELGEVEAVVREVSGVDGAVAVGWPVTPSGAAGIEVFLQAERADMRSLQSRIAARLPAYMAPRRIHLLAAIPLNANGKFDRKVLIQCLERTCGAATPAAPEEEHRLIIDQGVVPTGHSQRSQPLSA